MVFAGHTSHQTQSSIIHVINTTAHQEFLLVSVLFDMDNECIHCPR